MYMRSAPTETLTGLLDTLDHPGEALTVNGSDMIVETGRITLGTREIPVTEDGLEAIAGWVDFPTPFMHRLDPDLRSAWLTQLLARKPMQGVARVTDHGLRSIHVPGALAVDPRQVVEVASRVLGEEASVVDWKRTGKEFYFDSFTTEGTPLGDPAVGDLTRAGLRFFQNLGQNLVPQVGPFQYRLICTNGMETRNDGIKVDARGSSVDEVLANLEIAAQLAFGRVEQEVAHFYDMRNERVENPERLIARLATEHDLSDRLRVRLIDAAPSIVGEDGSTTMFDVIGLFTNQANDPALRRGVRLQLERFGGNVVSAHVDRCRSCQSKLN